MHAVLFIWKGLFCPHSLQIVEQTDASISSQGVSGAPGPVLGSGRGSKGRRGPPRRGRPAEGAAAEGGQEVPGRIEWEVSLWGSVGDGGEDRKLVTYRRTEQRNTGRIKGSRVDCQSYKDGNREPKMNFGLWNYSWKYQHELMVSYKCRYKNTHTQRYSFPLFAERSQMQLQLSAHEPNLEPRLWFLNPLLYWKEPGLPGEGHESRLRWGENNGSAEILCR